MSFIKRERLEIPGRSVISQKNPCKEKYYAPYIGCP
jgi:hypothetical protein